MHVGRVLHAAVLFGNDVLVAGGAAFQPNEMNSTELYDPAMNTWTPATAMAYGRQGQVAVSVGWIFEAGGIGINGTPIASAEVYSGLPQWRPAGLMHAARASATATLLNPGVPATSFNVLVVGGINQNSAVNRDAEVWSAARGN
jgi:hypothetical protein